jgi:ABC-type dipeptide/oligopeptide/nickel transport system permease component
VHRGFIRFLLRRAASAALLVLLVSSGALVLARLAPPADAFGTDPAVLAAERHRLGFDRPLAEQYVAWLARGARLDLGESLHFRRPVAALIKERAANTALLGLSALLLATGLGVPLGVFTGSRRGGILVGAARGITLVLLSVPPLVMSLAMLLLAVRTGWLPAGGLPDIPRNAGPLAALATTLRYLLLPSLALALPVAASIERLQSASIRAALAEPCMLAALARGVPWHRVLWRHAFPLSLRPVLAIYGITIGSLLSGSFAVEVVLSWSGLGQLMYQALQARDLYLVAGCAATGAFCLAAGIFLADLASAALDPRVEGPA